MTRHALRKAVRAREDLAEELRREHGAPDFARTLAEVRDSGVYSVPELAAVLGLSKQRVYQLRAEAER